MNLQKVNDPNDSRLTHFSWRRDSQLKPFNEMVIDSEKVVRRAIKHGISIKAILATDSHFERNRDLIEILGAQTNVYIAPESLMLGIVGHRVHQGIMALAERPADASLAPEGQRAVILDHVNDAQNVGTILRSCHAFGINDVYAIGGASPFVRRAIRVSMGSCFVLKIRHLVRAEPILDWLHLNDWDLFATGLGENSVNLEECPVPPKAAIALGNEESGLSAELTNSANHQLKISMHPGIDSLGVAAASAVTLHHFRSINL